MTNTGDQTNAGGDQSIRVSITPTWEAVAKISVEALLNGTTNGQSMAREEIIELGIKLDDAKEIIEERLKPTPSLQVQFGETEALIEGKDKTIAELKERVDKLGKTIDNLKDDFDKGQDYIADLENQIKEKDELIAIQRQQIERLEGYRADQVIYWDERNVQQPGLPGIKMEDPIHDKILDLILDSEVGKRNKLTDDALDLVGVRELMVYTINQQIKYNETHREGDE
jgi:archaellum component FlaC